MDSYDSSVRCDGRTGVRIDPLRESACLSTPAEISTKGVTRPASERRRRDGLGRAPWRTSGSRIYTQRRIENLLLGPLHSCLRPLYVNLLGALGGVRQHSHMILQDFQEAAMYRHKMLPAAGLERNVRVLTPPATGRGRATRRRSRSWRAPGRAVASRTTRRSGVTTSSASRSAMRITSPAASWRALQRPRWFPAYRRPAPECHRVYRRQFP